LGDIVFWTIMRTAAVIPALWILRSYINFELWWAICLMSIYLIIIHPMIIHYKRFEEKNKEIIESTLCSSCKHFDKTAVLCMKYDKHPSLDSLPCGGVDWEPGFSEVDSDIWEH